MSDIFAPLREPEPVAVPAPDEVRRRGDRLRRRRATWATVGAVVAVAIAMGAPSLVLGDKTKSDAPSPPVDSPNSRTVIPELFDLADGLPRGSVSSAGARSFVICGEPISLVNRATASQGVGWAERGDFADRALVGYPDAATARSVARTLVAAYEDCPRFTDDRGREWTTTVRPATHGDQGWVVAHSVVAPGPKVDFLEVAHIVRLGANLLITERREVHGISRDDLTDLTGDQVAALMHRQMCLLTEKGCAWRSDPDVLRPDGWGPWELGMSREEVEAAGAAGFSEAGNCTTVDLGSGQGWLSGGGVLVSIQVPTGVTTPAGVGTGASRDEVLLDNFYSVNKNGENVLRVRASPTADYEMRLERDQVTQLTLTAVGNEC